MHDNEKIDIVDCGNEVAQWLSKIILDKESGLRLGYYPDSSITQRSVSKGSWKKYQNIYKNFDDNAFVSVAFYSFSLLILVNVY